MAGLRNSVVIPKIFWVIDLGSYFADLGLRMNLDHDVLVWRAKGENGYLAL